MVDPNCDYGTIDFDDAIDNYGADTVNFALTVFVTEIYGEIKDNINKAVNESNYTELRAIVHKFKSTTGYLGANGFSKLCAVIQKACEDKISMEKIKEYCKIFNDNLELLYQTCKGYYDKLPKEEVEENENEIENEKTEHGEKPKEQEANIDEVIVEKNEEKEEEKKETPIVIEEIKNEIPIEEKHEEEDVKNEEKIIEKDKEKVNEPKEEKIDNDKEEQKNEDKIVTFIHEEEGNKEPTIPKLNTGVIIESLEEIESPKFVQESNKNGSSSDSIPTFRSIPKKAKEEEKPISPMKPPNPNKQLREIEQIKPDKVIMMKNDHNIDASVFLSPNLTNNGINNPKNDNILSLLKPLNFSSFFKISNEYIEENNQQMLKGNNKNSEDEKDIDEMERNFSTYKGNEEKIWWCCIF